MGHYYLWPECFWGSPRADHQRHRPWLSGDLPGSGEDGKITFPTFGGGLAVYT